MFMIHFKQNSEMDFFHSFGLLVALSTWADGCKNLMLSLYTPSVGMTLFEQLCKTTFGVILSPECNKMWRNNDKFLR